MPTLSKKGFDMPASPIRKLVPYAQEAKKNGKKVYHLNIGQPDIETPKVALDAIRNLDMNVIEYSNSEGIESYRKGLASYYQNSGIDIKPEEILITTGGSEALLFAFQTCLNPGEEIIIPEPFYANYNGFAVSSGVTIIPVEASIKNAFALPPIEDFEKLINEKTKGILICNPGNPTGYLYSKEELEKLRDLVKKYDLYLFADEVYREFCYDGAEPYSVMNLEGIDNNIVLVDSVSKRYSMCGARIGALISRNKELINTALKFAQARLSPPTFGQIASEGSFYCMASLPVKDSEDFCKWILSDFDYEGETVMMAPAGGFYANKSLGKNEVRMAYVLNKESLARSVKILDEALKVYPGRI